LALQNAQQTPERALVQKMPTTAVQMAVVSQRTRPRHARHHCALCQAQALIEPVLESLIRKHWIKLQRRGRRALPSTLKDQNGIHQRRMEICSRLLIQSNRSQRNLNPTRIITCLPFTWNSQEGTKRTSFGLIGSRVCQKMPNDQSIPCRMHCNGVMQILIGSAITMRRAKMMDGANLDHARAMQSTISLVLMELVDIATAASEPCR